jgi:hypothetical protein
MNLLNLEKLFPSMAVAALILIIIFNFMNPSYAADITTNESKNSKLDNFLSFNWIPNFQLHPVIIKNPFEESEEVKKISGILEEGSKFKYVKGVNSSASRLPNEGGDCWVMSDWLYKNIKKTGVECRIIQYETSLANNHRSVQIKINGEWMDLPYGKYGFDSRFAAAHSKPGMFVYKGN